MAKKKTHSFNTLNMKVPTGVSLLVLMVVLIATVFLVRKAVGADQAPLDFYMPF